jgi:hypothetical protein
LFVPIVMTRSAKCGHNLKSFWVTPVVTKKKRRGSPL